jgi:1-acyl-sn-glycerol-3-phosphate acyltransferase
MTWHPSERIDDASRKSSVTTRTASTPGVAVAACTVSSANASAKVRRSASVRPVNRDLPWAGGLTGTTTTQRTGAASGHIPTILPPGTSVPVGSPDPADRVACSRRKERPGAAREHSTIGRTTVRVRKLQQRRGWAMTVAATILKPTLLSTTSRTWIDGEKIPASGGCILAINHISHVDPLLSAHFVYDHGRLPRYLAKSGLFANKALGGFLTSAGQIPVERLSRNAIGAYDAAVRAIEDGECIIVYPEGTLTRDPDLWPMKGKTGAARIALATGCPVIPVGQWGAHEVLPPYTKRPHLLPRKNIVMKAGDPVPLDDLLALPTSAERTALATDRIMAAITALVADIRQEPAPTQRYDPRASGVREIGNPHDEAHRTKRNRTR